MKHFSSRNIIPVFILISILASCSASRNYNPDKKYSKDLLIEDFSLLRDILESKHPSIYWYTSKDSMDYYFEQGFRSIKDSMTELQFGWKVLAPLTHQIRCGHTSFSMSKDWNKFIKDRRQPSIPLYFKIWDDTMVVTANLNRKDSILKKGTIVTGINGIKSKELITKMFSYMVQDGYSYNVNYQRLSGSFPYFHRNIFGITRTYNIDYIDINGKERSVKIPYFNPAPDTTKKDQVKKPQPKPKPKKPTRQEKLLEMRSLQIDSTTAILTLNTFSDGHLRTFFRRSFRKLRKQDVKDLVIDLRSNGGGKINNYVLLSKYIRNSKFRVADTTVAVSDKLNPYARYISDGFWNNIGLKLFTRKKKDGQYHYRYWERHMVNPKTTNHFNGKVYVLTGGLTFSASTLFCSTVKGQENVRLVGEETGGGWHGNTGVMIPEITLPNTKLRVRLPLFRLVNYNHVAKTGSGIPPDIYVPPTVENVRRELDGKLVKVKQLIAASNQQEKSVSAGQVFIPSK